MERREHDRRRNRGDFRTEPRSSPASLLVLTVTAVLLGTAAVSALLGTGFDDATPHGQLLGALSEVAEAQESHYAANGAFARWVRTLDVVVEGEVELVMTRGSETAWRAIARSTEVELSCQQGGRIRDGSPVRDEPICYREGG